MDFDQLVIMEDPLYKKFQTELEKFSLKKNDKIIIAISGGLDSITLLILLYSCHEYELVNVHVNHGLHEKSIEHNLFVQELSHKLEIPFYAKKLNPCRNNKSTSIEEWARLERYSFLNSILDKTDSKFIMTAHHRNDQAVTLLMNLCRKTGVAGLKGIAKIRNRVIRPMLNLTKKEIVDFQNRNNFCFVEDPTNSDTSISRNYFRHKILKPWEKRYPEVFESIIKSMQYFNDWEASLDYLIMNSLIPNMVQNENKFIIPNKTIKPMPRTLKLRLIKILTGNRNELWSKHQFQLIEDFLNNDYTGNLFRFNNGWSLLHDREKIVGKKIFNKINNSIVINPNKNFILNNCQFRIDITNKISSDMYQDKLETVDWSKIKNKKLEIRVWKKGDFFQPLGMKGTQKISDFLINEKVDRISKVSQHVCTADEEIFWVCGKRISNWARITKDTFEMAKLTYKYL